MKSKESTASYPDFNNKTANSWPRVLLGKGTGSGWEEGRERKAARVGGGRRAGGTMAIEMAAKRDCFNSADLLMGG